MVIGEKYNGLDMQLEAQAFTDSNLRRNLSRLF